MNVDTGETLGDMPLEGEDGSITVSLDDPVSLDTALTYDDDDPNLVMAFMEHPDGVEFLRKASDIVYGNFTADWESSSDFRERTADDLVMLYGNLPPKEHPWRDCANGHVPITLENISRLAARVEAEVVGNYRSVFSVMPVGPAGEDLAQALTLHGNWQIRERLKDFPRQVSKAILVFFMVGDLTFYSYWDKVARVNRHIVLTPDNFVTPYVQSTMEPDYSDLPHYTYVFHRYKHELQAEEGAWYDVDKVIDGRKPSFDEDPDEVIREARAEVEGIDKPEQGDAPYKLLQYEGWFDLPERPTQRWCKVILDYATKAILSFTIHEETNWQERARFEKQSAELQGFRQSQMAVQMAAEQAQMQMAQTQAMHDQALPHMGPMQANEAGARLQQLHGQIQSQVPPPPPPPGWMQNPDDPMEQPAPARKDPIYMFSHGVCIESVNGNLGLSYGRIQADMNRAADVALNQFVDAATLANSPPILTTENVEMDDPIEVAPGKFVKVPGVMPGQLQANIMQTPFAPANQQLLELVNNFRGYAEEAVQAPGVLSGEPGKSGETFRGLATRVEEATKQLSVPAAAFCRVLKQVLVNNAKLNAVYLDDDEIQQVLDQRTGQFKTLQVNKSLYQQGYQVTIEADLRFASQAQRIAEADELVAMPKAVPVLQGNLAFQWYTAVKALQARGKFDVIPYLGQCPPVTQVFGMPTAPPPQMGLSAQPGPVGFQIPGGPPPQGGPHSGGGQGAPPGSGPPQGGIPGPKTGPEPQQQPN